MFKRAQDMMEMVQDRFRTTMRVVADLAESVGVPPSVTSLLQPKNGEDQWEIKEHQAAEAPRATAPEASPPVPAETAKPTAPEQSPKAEAKEEADDGKKLANKRRPVVGDRERSKGVRTLEVDDAIDGSTYLARIIWSLGVADLEGLGPLRPADIARMVMSRSAVSLEPPNVARYIRRSKPTTITVDRVEGGSNFYKLNDKGEKLFQDNFALN
jgi:type IV secretory pathway VirB10-like protein